MLLDFQRASIIKSYSLDAVDDIGKKVSTKCNLWKHVALLVNFQKWEANNHFEK